MIDDATGGKNGVPLSDEVKDALTKAGLPLATPPRGDNGKAGDAKTPGTTVANVAQQDYFADVATKVVLPMFKARNKPFVLVFWSRDPDGSQHNQGDSLNTITPGINGPTSMAGIKNADDNLAQLRKALDELGLAASTNIIVSADHGFSTISKESKTSPSAKVSYDDTPKDFLPMGFLAHRPREGARPAAVRSQRQEREGRRQRSIPRPATACSARIRKSPTSSSPPMAAPTSSISRARTRSSPTASSRRCSSRTTSAASSSMTSSAASPARCRCRRIDLKGKAATPTPSIVVNFRSYASRAARSRPTARCRSPTPCCARARACMAASAAATP